MKLTLMLCAMAMCLGANAQCNCCAKDNTLSQEEIADGWKLLFDGKDLAGWTSLKGEKPGKAWTVRNGELTILSKKEESKRSGDIITEGIYTNFILKVDFKLTFAANSGIKYFYDKSVNGGTTLEYQVLHDCHPDAKLGKNGNRRIASFYDCMPAQNQKTLPPGEWNHAEIVSVGNHVEHWLNGEMVLTFERGSESFRKAVQASKFAKWGNWGEQKAGHILLQDHTDHVSFKNIKIKIID